MLKGLWALAWLETKIFAREPMGLVGTLGLPVVIFILLGRAFGAGGRSVPGAAQAPFNVAILAALLIAVSAVLSLVAIMAIYREGGILKRLRATPLAPLTILSAHVVVKLGFTLASLALLMAAGRQFFPGAMTPHWLGFSAALLLSVLSILSLGFVVASVVPTARFAQPVGAAVLYPMVVLSGLFFPIEALPRTLEVVAWGLPTTHAVALMQGIWDGGGWAAHWDHVAGLATIFAVCAAVASKTFRWE
ncbi:MAG: ABC transporter permease [Vicinamibacterales bacterium]|nr:ABC transporter permease [Vicinamibacterales bacterium]